MDKIIEHLFPVFFLLGLGVVLRRTGYTDAVYLRTTDRLIYYMFFPILLFWKIGGAHLQFSAGAVRFYLASSLAVFLMYVLTLVLIRVVPISSFQAGSFSQSCYRFNTYVGVAVILSVLGEEGLAQYGVLIGLLIPPINVLAVATLVWFEGDPQPLHRQSAVLLNALIRNPLILGCAGGLVYAALCPAFPAVIDATLGLTASVTLPMALLSIGGGLTIDSVRNRFGMAMAATLLKQLGLPLLGWGMFWLFDVQGLLFQVGMLFFALPTSTAMYVLSAQHRSDTELAAAIIVLSTIFSFASLAVVLVWAT